MILDGAVPAEFPRGSPKISIPSIKSVAPLTKSPAVGGARKPVKSSIWDWDGPPQGLALNVLISGQFGFAHKNASNPKI